MRRGLLVGFSAAVVTACVIYTGQPKADARVTAGRGLTGRFYVDDVRFVTAELLWGDSTGYLVLMPGDSGRVVWAPTERIREVWLPVSELVQVKPATPTQLEALRGASRFPYGMNAAAVQLILEQRGQANVDTLRSDTPPAAAPFMESARAGTSKYRSVDAAVADGFKPVGTEFPFMGEHWVNLPRVLENRFDATQPSVLIYVNGAKGKELAGAGYTALLGPGEKPPVSAAPESAWHEHNGSVVEESLPGLHEVGHHGERKVERDGVRNDGRNGGRDDALRLVVMHAWIWMENPAGPFVTDNRALPFVRAGVPRREMSASALSGLALLQDSAGYYLQTMRTSLRADAAESGRLEGAIAAARRVSAAGDDEFTAAWDSLWNTLHRDLPRRSDDLRRVRIRLEGTQ